MGDRTLLSRLLGMIAPDYDVLPDRVPPPQPIRVVPGGPSAAELCMLPVDWDGLEFAAETERATRERDVRVVQLKADGINAMFVDGAVIGGRDGAPLDCALQAQPALARLERTMGEPMVFLGEYVAEEGFNATLAEHRRQRGEGVFWLYDAVPFAAWHTGRVYGVPIEDRLERLRTAFHTTDTGLFVGMLDWWLLDAGELRAKAHEVWAAGYEGLVSKRRGSPYVRARCNDWRKVKQRFRAECDVVDTIHKDGRLHSIIVRGPQAGGGKPIKLTGGWSAGDARAIDIGMGEGGSGRIVEIEFGLTTGTSRTSRSPKFKGITA